VASASSGNGPSSAIGPAPDRACDHAENRWQSNDNQNWYCQACGALDLNLYRRIVHGGYEWVDGLGVRECPDNPGGPHAPAPERTVESGRTDECSFPWPSAWHAGQALCRKPPGHAGWHDVVAPKNADRPPSPCPEPLVDPCPAAAAIEAEGVFSHVASRCPVCGPEKADREAT
jgi:hypothetical protein